MQIARRVKAGLTSLVAVTAMASPEVRIEVLAGLDFGRLAAREVRVFVPDQVTSATPILIALDGQNMTAWRLEDALTALAAQERRTVPLVVAIPSGKERLDEYGMADTPDYAGRGKRAAEFQQFVVGSVLPAVRTRYGIKADPARTGIMGSSLGGLAAFDLAWRRREVFGFAGIFSGSFWWRGEDGPPAVRQASRLAHRLVRESAARTTPQRWWFSVGTKEETDDRDGNGVVDAVQDTTELIDELGRKGWSQDGTLAYVQAEGGEHNEASWAKALPGFFDWALPSR